MLIVFWSKTVGKLTTAEVKTRFQQRNKLKSLIIKYVKAVLLCLLARTYLKVCT